LHSNDPVQGVESETDFEFNWQTCVSSGSGSEVRSQDLPGKWGELLNYHSRYYMGSKVGTSRGFMRKPDHGGRGCYPDSGGQFEAHVAFENALNISRFSSLRAGGYGRD
jgi:hypothetical protein